MEDEEAYKRAKARVEELKGFYTHLVVYLGVNITLVIINLVTSPRVLWFYWVTIFWGIGLLWHAISVFTKHKVLTKEWEERKIKEIMEKEKKK
jgi:hypothetical protein